MQGGGQQVGVGLQLLARGAAQQAGGHVLGLGDLLDPFGVLLFGRGVVDPLLQGGVLLAELLDLALAGVLGLVELQGLGLEFLVVLVFAAFLGETGFDDRVDLLLGERLRIALAGASARHSPVDEADAVAVVPCVHEHLLCLSGPVCGVATGRHGTVPVLPSCGEGRRTAWAAEKSAPVSGHKKSHHGDAVMALVLKREPFIRAVS